MTLALLRALLNSLQSAPASDLNELQTVLGWTLAHCAVLLDPGLRLVDPCLQIHFDWMHVYVVGGIFNSHVGQMMSALRNSSFTYETLQRYLDLWEWPKSVMTQHGHGVITKDKAT
eukprot:8520882-Karenia_brevis.AAC.1